MTQLQPISISERMERPLIRNRTRKNEREERDKGPPLGPPPSPPAR